MNRKMEPGLGKYMNINRYVSFLVVLSFFFLPLSQIEHTTITAGLNLGKTILIDDDAVDDPENLTWDTISEGLDNADRGDTIKIFNGTYTEHVSIDIQNLRLEGQNTDLFGDDTGGAIITGSGSNDVISVTASGVSLDNLMITQSGTDKYGITIQSDSTIITNNVIHDCGKGIRCTSVNFVSITNNEIINFTTTAIQITNCDNVIISNNKIFGFDGFGEKGMSCEQMTNSLLDNNYVFTDQSGTGIELFHLSQQNEISDNRIENNTMGIKCWWSANDNRIGDNDILNGTDDAIHLDYSTSVQSSKLHIINNNLINNQGYGIYSFHAKDAMIENNIIKQSGNDGIYCEWSNYSKFLNNDIIENDDGIFQISCIGNTFQDNRISFNDEGIYVSNSENTKILDNHFWNNTNAVTIETSQGSQIVANTIYNNTDGVLLFTQANSNTISSNDVYNNSRYGLHLTFARDNMVMENNFAYNQNIGVFVEVNSNDNTFYHNNFIDNGQNAFDNCDNDWNKNNGGNYWSDYSGSDSDGNGVGDSPYNITGGSNQDHYPFMIVDGWLHLPELQCQGSLTWSNVRPGSIQQGSFTIENSGTSGSLLDWNITSFPDWGEWTFNPDSEGEDLMPEDGPITVTVFVETPEQQFASFSGDIIVENVHNDDEQCTIPISLSTPKNKMIFIHYIIEQWFSQFSALFGLFL